jgi:cell division septal protein FtsQ
MATKRKTKKPAKKKKKKKSRKQKRSFFMILRQLSLPIFLFLLICLSLAATFYLIFLHTPSTPLF